MEIRKCGLEIGLQAPAAASLLGRGADCSQVPAVVRSLVRAGDFSPALEEGFLRALGEASLLARAAVSSLAREGDFSPDPVGASSLAQVEVCSLAQVEVSSLDPEAT
jgi:hypothetical protein